jgi:transcription elongation factor GreA
MLAKSMSILDICKTALDGFEVEVLDEYPVNYVSTCSREKLERYFCTMSDDDIRSMADEKGVILTESGLKKLEEELDYLVSVRRNEISEQIAVARGFGDLSENAEYDEAKKEQAKVENEITRLQQTIRTATVVADDEISTDRVNIGTVVSVKDLEDGETYEYAIVGANEADPTEDRISNESPVGAGLIGAKKGQTVTIQIPAGELKYKILSIKKL